VNSRPSLMCTCKCHRLGVNHTLNPGDGDGVNHWSIGIFEPPDVPVSSGRFYLILSPWKFEVLEYIADQNILCSYRTQKSITIMQFNVKRSLTSIISLFSLYLCLLYLVRMHIVWNFTNLSFQVAALCVSHTAHWSVAWVWQSLQPVSGYLLPGPVKKKYFFPESHF